MHIYTFSWRLSQQTVGRPIKAENVEAATRRLIFGTSYGRSDGRLRAAAKDIRVAGLAEKPSDTHLVVSLMSGPQQKRPVAVMEIGRANFERLHGLT